MKEKAFKNFKVVGSVAAPFTPFRSDGEINFDKFEEYVEYLKDHQFQYVFVNGTLAEGMSMTLEERKKVAEAWMKAAKGKLKIILHVGTSNIKDSQDLAKHASSIGVEAMASLCPSYIKPTNEETLVDTMCEIAKVAPEVPFFYYCINFVTGIYLDPFKFLLLAKDRIPNLVGLKHSSKELNNAYNCTLVDPNRFQVLMGTDAQFLPYFTFGINVPVTAPYMGTLFYKLKKAYDSRDRETAQAIQTRILELNNIRGKYGAGIEIAKAMFGILSGIDIGPVRLPITRLTADRQNMLKKDLEAFGPVE
ncbi:N-acetylneuraminate lyase-like isoform X2 [Ostrea edulis]|uniref:N-acetylneuraminate lyase-like isoform X2 n=1 Tax=Ostrea edulis TaxID=37623 RepID=UPI0024AFCC99|nr:N-acetylneuraminate lyase-like isoform X2 [Ostrea edulis]